MRSVWSATSLLALSNGAARPKAGASSTHSKRFARFGCGFAPASIASLRFNVASFNCMVATQGKAVKLDPYIDRTDYLWVMAVAHGSRKPGYWKQRVV